MTTTTEPTTGPDIYTALEALPKVQVSRHTTEMIEAVEQITDDIADRLEQATEMVTMHEAQAKLIVAELEQALDEDSHERASLNDGLHGLMFSLSGALKLYKALERLSEMCNPDTISYEDVIAMREGMSSAGGDDQ